MTAADYVSLAEAFERVPPHDLQAEMCCLGGMLMSANAIADVRAITSPGDHYRPAHQMVHEAILRLDDAGEPVDAVTVADELERRGELGRIGGAPHLHTLLASVPTAASAGYYARIVQRKAIMRRTIEAGTRIAQMGYTGDDGDAGDIAEAARREAEAILPAPAGGGVQATGDLLLEVLDSLERGEQVGLATPLADLNLLINGFCPGEMTVLAARPGIGKSLTALGAIAHAVIGQHVPAVLFSMEMSRREIMTRLIAAEGKVPLWSMLHRQLTDNDWDRISRAQQRIAACAGLLVIDDTRHCTLAHIRARLRGMARTAPAGLAVIDYLQLLTSDGKTENRQTEVAAFSRGIKLLAGEFGIPVLVLAQLNRGPEQRKDKRPQLSDLRESGAQEQDADVVILLHREDAHDRESPRMGEIDFIVAKNRNGPQGTVTAAFQGEYARIVDMAPVREPAGGVS